MVVHAIAGSSIFTTIGVKGGNRTLTISVFDLFAIGIGPSSSHTVGPMRAAAQFMALLAVNPVANRTARISVTLYGSLAATGRGHGTQRALILGLLGQQPETVPIEEMASLVAKVTEAGHIRLPGTEASPVLLSFEPVRDIIFQRGRSLPAHPNGMRFMAFDDDGGTLLDSVFYSIGGGFLARENAAGEVEIQERDIQLPHDFDSGAQLLEICAETGEPISEIMLKNELTLRSREAVFSELLHIWQVMQECIKTGCQRTGVMPGLQIPRRAAGLYTQLQQNPEKALTDPLTIIDWVNLYALAVNEENASGGRVVTAPTNGAAGIIPAVLLYYRRFIPGANDEGVVRFLLTAGAIGILFKKNASISGAEVGCQGEVGSACAMAAGGLAEVLGATPAQVENAAEIGMEHNLGLTCDPIGGLVQVPCIERNAMAAVKAINAARLALRGDGQHIVSLDRVIKTMRDTGRDMKTKYKETSRGGLATNVVHIPVNHTEC
ncbi:MAG: L-serine dehydratase [Candidatus Azotimanducaceae bacterium]|jgi:L-serine dehydratase